MLSLAAEPFDRLFVIGDLVSYGPHAREVVDFVERRADLVLQSPLPDDVFDQLGTCFGPSWPAEA
jgi:hypothetical protein